MTEMGSSTAVILVYFVALSVVATAVVPSAAAAELPPEEAAGFISEAVLASTPATAETSRKLIGAGGNEIPGPCPVRFDLMKGYEALGAKCKKPPPMKECCAAFKALACPHNKLLNNVDNGCADEMFYFIQTKGKLKPGTIFDNCIEGPHGLKC